MNEFDQERIDMITIMLMYITKLPEDHISSYVKMTEIYSNILSGDELTLYDSYAANIMDMVDEWKAKDDIPSELRNITAQQVNASNTWLRTKEIKDAKQARTLLAFKHKHRRSTKPRKIITDITFSKHTNIRKLPKTSGRCSTLKAAMPIPRISRRK